MHVNGATRLPNGNTLISIRNFNTIAEVSRDGVVVWKQELPLGDMPLEKKLTYKSHPHDPEVLPNGNILVALTGINTVLEIDRKTGQQVWKWEYPTTDGRPVHIRDANRLPNGNRLIVTANSIIELAPDGAPVWKMVATSISPAGPRFTYLFKAQRVE
jgi:outer membrane protein assembly factor BamB